MTTAEKKSNSNSPKRKTEKILKLDDDPRYLEALSAFQQGEWEKSLKLVNKLIDFHPSNVELIQFQKDLSTRVAVDEEEVETKINDRKIAIRKRGIQSIAAVVLFIGALLVWRGYASIAKENFEQQQAIVMKEVLKIELAGKMRDAENLLLTDRAIDALILLREIEEVDPSYDQLLLLLPQAEFKATLEEQYYIALDFVEEEKISEALENFQVIYQADPYYRDVEYQISQLEREYLLDDKIATAGKNYQAGNWGEAVAGYESVRRLDSSYQSEEVERLLFESYISAIEQILNESDLSIEELEQAELYYSKSRALRPQDKETLNKRIELHNTISGLLVNKYVILTQLLIAEAPDSIEVMKKVEDYLSKAILLSQGSISIREQYNLARTYLSGIDNYNKGLWELAISDMSFIYSADRNFASGTSRQVLYESFVAQGDVSLASGNYSIALGYFEKAATLAVEDSGSKLRLYEIQLKVAFALGKVGSFKEAATLYTTAINEADIKSRITEEDSILEQNISDAESLFRRREYQSSYNLFSNVLSEKLNYYVIITHTVEEGDYLSSIARRFNSTVHAIVEFNEIANPNIITPGFILLIPSFQ